MNIANRLTFLRIILTFVFMFILLYCHGLIASLLAFALFIFAAISDFFDGRIARKRNMVTDFGRLMDPIADKVLVLTAFMVFVQLRLVEAWMVVIIIFREILITSLRLFALNKGQILSAARAGKQKTMFQMVVIFLILLFMVAKELMLVVPIITWNPNWEILFRDGIYIMMLVTVGLTLYSGLSYLWDNREVIARL